MEGASCLALPISWIPNSTLTQPDLLHPGAVITWVSLQPVAKACWSLPSLLAPSSWVGLKGRVPPFSLPHAQS